MPNEDSTVHWPQIRALFTDEDVQHMAELGLDLTSRGAVADDSEDILDRVSRNGPGRMPPPPRPRWPEEWVELFRTWRAQNFPD